MRLRLFRNATQRLHYAGRELLLDPYFAPKHSRPSFTGRSPNPLVELPCSPVCRFAPKSHVIAIHLDSLDHGTVSRQDLRARAAGIRQPLIPEDGETLQLPISL